MLEDILAAVSNLGNKKKQVRLIKGKLFVRDSALSVVNSNLLDILKTRGSNFDREKSLSAIKKYLSDCQYYFLGKNDLWRGYVFECKLNVLRDIPEGNGELISCAEHLVYGDPGIASNSGVKLFERGKYIAEFNYVIGRYKICTGAFDRFVRSYRGNLDISLRDCLFEMYRRVKRAGLASNEDIIALKKRLEKLKVHNIMGSKRFLDGKRPGYLYSKAEEGYGSDYIFVRNNDEIIYCQPVLLL